MEKAEPEAVLLDDKRMEGEDNNERKGEGACYYLDGYEIQVHFSGKKTLSQCLRALAERGIESDNV